MNAFLIILLFVDTMPHYIEVSVQNYASNQSNCDKDCLLLHFIWNVYFWWQMIPTIGLKYNKTLLNKELKQSTNPDMH